MKQDEISRLTSIPLFPTLLFCRSYPDPKPLNDKLRHLASTIRSKDPDGRTISNRGGWHSNNIRMEPNVAPLIEFIDDTMQRIKKIISASDDLDFTVTNCWININGFGARNAVHSHGNAHFSGVYYVEVPYASGEIEFKDPNTYLREAHSFGYKRIDVMNCTALRYSPVSGLLLIFPGYLPHEVLENQSENERVSVSFNVDAGDLVGSSIPTSRSFQVP